MDETLTYLKEHLWEKARRAYITEKGQYTLFLSPPEQQCAYLAARENACEYASFGGYEQAERKMVRFGPDFGDTYPLRAVCLTWLHQKAPAHKDILGAVLALGIKRSMVGDIVLEPERAILYAEQSMAPMITEQLRSAGRVQLQTELLTELPQVEAMPGREITGTVMSLRLDAVIGCGYHLSRGKAEELVRSGNVKLRYAQCLKPDERIREGDVISAHGMGRLVVAELGAPTKKGRLPVTLLYYGQTK